MKIESTYYSFFRKKLGQRDYPYVFFYPLPFLAISKTGVSHRFRVTIGWLFWTAYLKFK
jgi:hypothetical protein